MRTRPAGRVDPRPTLIRFGDDSSHDTHTKAIAAGNTYRNAAWLNSPLFQVSHRESRNGVDDKHVFSLFTVASINFTTMMHVEK
jgi:hypothetical protein